MGAFAAGTATADLSPSGRSRAPDVRQSLVDALAAVPGLTASTAAPDVATAGSAWPRWIQTTYDGPLCTVATDRYDLIAVLPGDYLTTTVERGDELRDLIELALSAVVRRVEYAEPVAVQFNDRQTMPGLRFRVIVR